MKIHRKILLFTITLFFFCLGNGVQEFDLELEIFPDYNSNNIVLLTKSPDNKNNPITLTYILSDNFSNTDIKTVKKLKSEEIRQHDKNYIVYQYDFESDIDSMVIISDEVSDSLRSFDINFLGRFKEKKNSEINIKVNFHFDSFIKELRADFYPNSLDPLFTPLFNKDQVFNSDINSTYYSDFIQISQDSMISKISLSYSNPNNITFNLSNMASLIEKQKDFTQKKRRYDNLHIIILGFVSIMLFLFFVVLFFKQIKD